MRAQHAVPLHLKTINRKRLLAIAIFAAIVLAAVKLLCVSNQKLKGEETVGSCLNKNERFAVMDEYGLVRILSPEEVELTKAFNPKILETRAYGVTYFNEAPPCPLCR
jgi:hypothetical protein